MMTPACACADAEARLPPPRDRVVAPPLSGQREAPAPGHCSLSERHNPTAGPRCREELISHQVPSVCQSSLVRTQQRLADEPSMASHPAGRLHPCMSTPVLVPLSGKVFRSVWIPLYYCVHRSWVVWNLGRWLAMVPLWAQAKPSCIDVRSAPLLSTVLPEC